MSTKIYNGMRIPKTSIEDLITKCNEIGEILRKESSINYFEKIVKVGIYNYDRLSVGYFEEKELKPSSLLESLNDKLSESYFEKKRKNLRDPFCDYSFEISIHIAKKNLPDYFLIIPFVEQRFLLKLFKKLMNAEDYPYWDNTDPPRNISSKNWKKRSEEWDEALGELGIPSQSGLAYTFVSEENSGCYSFWNHYNKKYRIPKSLMSLDDRAANLSSSILKSSLYRDMDFNDLKTKDISILNRKVIDINCEIKEGKHKEKYDEIYSNVKKSLKEKIKIEDLKKNMSDIYNPNGIAKKMSI